MFVRVYDFLKLHLPTATDVVILLEGIPFDKIENRQTSKYNHSATLQFIFQGKKYSIIIPILVGSILCPTAYRPGGVDEGYIITTNGSKLVFKNKEVVVPYGIRVMKEDRSKDSTKGEFTIEYSHLCNQTDEMTKYQLIVMKGPTESGVALIVSFSKRGKHSDPPPKYIVDVCEFFSGTLHKSLDETRTYMKTKYPNVSFGKIKIDRQSNQSTESTNNMNPIVEMMMVALNHNIINPQVIDMDSYANKAILTPGHLMFRHVSTHLREIMNGEKGKTTEFDTSVAFQQHKDDKLLMHHETHVKSITQTRITCVDVSQYAAPEIRGINLSQIGNICPYYTPESADVGLKKELAVFAAISVYRSYNITKIMEGFDMTGYITDSYVTPPGYKLMMHNGARSFVTPEFFAELKNRTKRDIRYFDVSLVETMYAYIVISNGSIVGHFSYVVKDGKVPTIENVPENVYTNSIDIPRSVVEWALKQGYIEFITAIEEYKEALELSDVDSRTTHCMLDPNGIYGTLALSVPFTNHNYGVRVSYNANMVRQGIDTSIVNTNNTKCKKLVDGERPIVLTTLWDHCYPTIKNVKNIFVMVCARYTNNEDAIIMSEHAALNKFRYTVHSYKRIMLKSTYEITSSEEDEILDLGLPIIGQYYKTNDTVMSYRRGGDNYITYEYATLEAHGTLVNVVREANGSYLLTFFEDRNYICGDKLCARYSQKGVVSEVIKTSCVTGGIFEGSNIRPDIILSPFVIPTRMTMGLIMEMKAATYIVAKAFYEHGRISREALVNCVGETLANTCILSECPNDIIKSSDDPLGEISKHYTFFADAFKSYDYLNEVNIYNYVDGQLVLVAPVSYMLLRHHTKDKVKFSTFDPTVKHTDLMMKGVRGRLSGLKIGLQEILALFSIGATSMLSDFSKTTQNNVIVYSCVSCGQLDVDKTSPTCRYCLGSMKPLALPFAFVLVYRILLTQNCTFLIWPKITGNNAELDCRM